MMNALKKFVVATVSLAALTLAPVAHAKLITFDIKWSNTEGAMGLAALTLDSSLIQVSSGATNRIGIDQIDSLTVTINGASSGNGTYGKSMFTGISFRTATQLDLSKDLIGQQTTGRFGRPAQYGLDQSDATGAFDLFTDLDTPPMAAQPFSIITDRTSNDIDLLRVSSILARDGVSAVPEPTTYLLLLAGLGVVAVGVRRQRTVAGSAGLAA